MDNLKILVETYNKFYNSLKERKDVGLSVLDYYAHRYNSIKAVHCLGNPKRKYLQDIRKILEN